MTLDKDLLARLGRELERRYTRETEEPSPEEKELWRRLEQQNPESFEVARRHTAAIEALRDELLGLAPGERLDPRFHSEDLLELLLEESELAQLDDPDSAILWADLALPIAEALRDKRWLASNGKARAARLKANALRLRGELEKAEHAFTQARVHLDDNSLERPYFNQFLAVLRWEQHSLDEAIGLLLHAASLFRAAKRPAERAACLLLLGLLQSEMSFPASGLPPLLEGWPQGSPHRRPYLSLCGGFALAAHFGEIGEIERGRDVLAKTMDLYPLVRDERHILQAIRWEGSARARLGEIGQAEELLETLRRKNLDRRDLPELTLTSLALGAVLAELGRPEEIDHLIADSERNFASEEGCTFAVEALRALRDGVERGDGARRSAAWAASEFRRLCRLFDIPLGPIPFA